ncbi:unnamed protein product [Eruca vesicaria subsp. sativa]|uniref:Uncharacterized protein n=1 Tax=Eruca vesicaria subsp. sativa TaxID=29727 RepID=A0ABC8L3Q9_ERUVS|nr:unnamed protein product [Eruca vesicaria subsp. sativa]
MKQEYIQEKYSRELTEVAPSRHHRGAWLTPRSSAGGGRDKELHQYAKESPHRIVLKTLADDVGSKKEEPNNHHWKPWMLSLELRKRSPTRSSDSSFCLGPWEQDGKTLIRATDGGDMGKQRRHRPEGKEAATPFIPASLRGGSDPEPAQDIPKIYQADGASWKLPDNHDLALSPETLGTHPDVDLVAGSGHNQAKTREGGARRR